MNSEANKINEDFKTVKLINSKFESIAFEFGDGDDGNFLSGWQCENPFIKEFISSVKKNSEKFDHTKYSYYDSYDDLLTSILLHHKNLDTHQPEAVICGCGSTSLLSTFAAYLASTGVKRVYYISPLYITLHTALHRFKIETIPVSDKHPYEKDFSLNLPKVKNSFLLLTDPVWIAGVPIQKEYIEEISKWQNRYDATIFVDGSLQYMPWDGNKYESTSILNPSKTIRLVCPSKQLCIHGYRFSYMLVPSNISRKLNWTYTSLFGPSPVDSISFGQKAIQAIIEGHIPRQLSHFIRSRFELLIMKDAIEPFVTPECGYFIFAKILKNLPDNYLLIDGSFFAKNDMANYSKLNLLSPSISLLTSTNK
jgi:aspartate/methionine/tyrosine aminotransferase